MRSERLEENVEMKPGTLVQFKDEWLNPGERKVPYVVVEDRDDRILVKMLPEYDKLALGTVETCAKFMVDVIDDKSAT